MQYPAVSARKVKQHFSRNPQPHYFAKLNPKEVESIFRQSAEARVTPLSKSIIPPNKEDA